MMPRMLVALLAVAVAAADTTVKGVTFSDEQARQALDDANMASWETLVYTNDIYKWKADNIVQGRRYRTLEQLAAVDGVTHTVLRLLREKTADRAVSVANAVSYPGLTQVLGFSDAAAQRMFASRPICSSGALAQAATDADQATLRNYLANPALCFSNADCTYAERCTGIPIDRIVTHGQCTPNVAPEGDNTACTEDILCPKGLICVGLSAFGPTDGTCRPAWMGGTFRGLRTATVDSTVYVAVWGLATVPVDSVMLLRDVAIQHAESLKIVVTDPDAQAFTVFDGPELAKTNPAVTLPTQIRVTNTGDARINGAWTVTVTNPGETATGSFAFSIYFTSRWD